MKNFTYENQGASTYLVYSVSKDDIIDTMALGMITNNHVSGLAQTTCVRVNEDKLIKYNVSAKITVSQFFMGAVNKARLLGVFRGIINALLSSEDYMIDLAMILLDLEHIFVDVSNCETILICLPVHSDEIKPIDLLSFFKNIMFSSQFDQTENCDYFAVIMNHLNSTPSFSLGEFKTLLDKLSVDEYRTFSSQPQKVEYRNSGSVSNASFKGNPEGASTVNNQAQPVVKSIQSAEIQLNINQTPASPFDNTATIQAPIPPKAGGQQVSKDKPMSKKYLLQHYSKENKAIYDAQHSSVNQTSTSEGLNRKADEAAPDAEKPMTMMYLLQHYSKENKAIYDAQQAAKRTKNGTPKFVESKKKNSGAASFSIPGQENSFAIPDTDNNVEVVSPIEKTSSNHVPVYNNTYSAQIQQPVYKSEQLSPVNVIAENYQVYNGAGIDNSTRAGSSSMNFGETTVLGGGAAGETTVLNGEMSAVVLVPHIIRTKNNEKINVNKPVFRIGKEKSYVDYFVADNTAISRSHANIVTREDRYFIVDTNSTNHTFVDGQMIPSNSEIEIGHGTKIRLANEDFEFNLY